jgi:ACS family hexuronate transporter-like MFS transporter
MKQAGMKFRGMRWWMVGLVTLGLIVNYLARNTLSVAAPTMMAELHISTQQYSYIVVAWQVCYAVMQPVAGFVLDAIGTKIGFAVFALAWSLACASAAMAIGWFNIGSSIGALCAPPLVVWCILHAGWQWSFVVVGAIGTVWTLIWSVFYKHPRDQKMLSDEERDYILSGQEARHQDAAKKAGWRQIVKSQNFWSIAIPRFLSEPAWQTFNAWIPLYMATERHMNLKEIAAFAWLPFLAADIGCVLGGYLSPIIHKRFNVSLFQSRKWVMVIGSLSMIAPGCVGLVESPYTAILLLCVGGFAHQTLSGALYAITSDVFGKNEVATATGLAGMSGYLGATLFTLLFGVLVTHVGYSPMFVVLAVFDVLAAIVVWTLVRESNSGTPRPPLKAVPSVSAAHNS